MGQTVGEFLKQIEQFIESGADKGAYIGLQVGGYNIPIANVDKQPRDFQDTIYKWREKHGLINGAPVGPYDKPSLIAVMRKLREEYLELKTEANELIQSTSESTIMLTESTKENITKILHEAADLVYVAFHISAVFGFDLTEVWDAVADSNDTKNGTIKYGNVTKGDGHVPADIGAVVDRQIKLWQDYITLQEQINNLEVGEEMEVQ